VRVEGFEDSWLGMGDAYFARDGRISIGDVFEHVEQVAVFGVDQVLQGGQGGFAIAGIGQTLEKGLARIRVGPDAAKFFFIAEEGWQLAKQFIQKFFHRDRFAIRIPERGLLHVLDLALFPVCQSYAHNTLFPLEFALILIPGIIFRAFLINPTSGLFRVAIGRQGIPIPLRIVEVVVGTHKVVDGEELFVLIQTRATPDDLFELDHGVDRTHEDDVAYIAGIHTGGKLVRGGQDGGDGFLVVLKFAQVLFTQLAFVGGHAHAVMRVTDAVELVDQIAHRQGMILRGAEDQAFLALVDVLQEDLDPFFLAGFDLDDAVEIGFFVQAAGFDLTFQHLVIGSVDVVIQGGLNAFDLEGRQKAIVDAIFERIDIHRLAEVAVGVDVVAAARRGGQSQLHSRGKMLHDFPPGGFIVGTPAMTLINHDEVKEICGIFAKVVGAFLAAHESLEDGEKDAAVGGDASQSGDLVGTDAHQGIFGEGGEGVEGLIGQDVAIRQEEDARQAFAIAFQVPAGVIKLPGDLEGDEGLAGAGCQRQQDALFVRGDGCHGFVDRDLLIVAQFFRAAHIFIGHLIEFLEPVVLLAESQIPEFLRGGEFEHIAFRTRLHVDLVDGFAVGGVGVSELQLLGVILGLGDAFPDRDLVRFGFDNRQFAPVVLKDIIGDQWFLATTPDHDTPGVDLVFTGDTAAWHNAPTRSTQLRFDSFGSGIGFVHGCPLIAITPIIVYLRTNGVFQPMLPAESPFLPSTLSVCWLLYSEYPSFQPEP